MIFSERIWLKTACVLQLLTAAIHSLSFFNKPVPQNDTEKQLLDLMINYKQDMGAGFSPSTQDIFISLSACFTLLLLMGGLINWQLIRSHADNKLIRRLTIVQVVVFGICFLVMF